MSPVMLDQLYNDQHEFFKPGTKGDAYNRFHWRHLLRIMYGHFKILGESCIGERLIVKKYERKYGIKLPPIAIPSKDLNKQFRMIDKFLGFYFDASVEDNKFTKDTGISRVDYLRKVEELVPKEVLWVNAFMVAAEVYHRKRRGLPIAIPYELPTDYAQVKLYKDASEKLVHKKQEQPSDKPPVDLFEDRKPTYTKESGKYLSLGHNNFVNILRTVPPGMFDFASMHKKTFTEQMLEDSAPINTTNTKLGEKPMKYQVKEFINGIDVTQLNDDQIISVIKDSEAEIKELEAIDTKSKKVDELIKSKKADLESIVTLLDNRK